MAITTDKRQKLVVWSLTPWQARAIAETIRRDFPKADGAQEDARDLLAAAEKLEPTARGRELLAERKHKRVPVTESDGGDR